MRACLPVAGSATAIHHGKGQAIANIIFWEFQVDMVGKYGDAALEWFGRLSHKADREAVRVHSETKAYMFVLACQFADAKLCSRCNLLS